MLMTCGYAPLEHTGWVAALTPGMIVAASTTLLADSRSGGRGGILPWALLIAGSVASLAANVAVAQPTPTGRVIAAWPSFALIAAYELLMRQVRRSAAESGRPGQKKLGPHLFAGETTARTVSRPRHHPSERSRQAERPSSSGGAGRDVQRQAWQWALANRVGDGSLPSGREIARRYGRHERWGRLVKRSGAAGEFASGSEPGEPGLRLVEQPLPSTTGE
jgi:hypothetical protein